MSLIPMLFKLALMLAPNYFTQKHPDTDIVHIYVGLVFELALRQGHFGAGFARSYAFVNGVLV